MTDRRIDTVVVGAGHSGLAMSHTLAARGIDHVILERGEVAHSWRTERWDSLTLLTPNWQSRLPGHAYDGDDPDGFMAVPEVIDFITGYAGTISAPLETATTVTAVSPTGDGYRVKTDQGAWKCRALVLASGACNRPSVPAFSRAVPASVDQFTPMSYRNPDQLAPGGVLVVGASATGLQLAYEIQRSGRQVTLAVGEHVRMPRLYRGRDIQWWMDASGLLDERYDEVDDIVRARNLPSPQLVGTPTRITLDLNALTDIGVRLVGRIAGVNGDRAQLSGSLRNVCNLADLKLGRLLDTFDEWAVDNGIDAEVDPPERPARTRVEDSPPLALGLGSEICSIVWATGYRPDFSWLDLPVMDPRGRFRHDGGVADLPGVYLLGMPFLRRRKSSFIHGAEDDARDLGAHLAGYLDATARVA